MPTIECVTLEAESKDFCGPGDCNPTYPDIYDAQCGPGECSPVE